MSCLAVLLLSHIPYAISAEISMGTPYTLEPVVVTATRAPIRADQTTANVTVITAEEIERLPATSVAEVLQYIPGVYVEINSGPGSFAGTISIQGSETRHVAVYQDNVPLEMMANPRTDLSYLPIGNIEKIEIYKGAASAAWGSSLGGVINIITKAPDSEQPFSISATGSYGENQTLRTRAAASGTCGRLGWLVSGVHEKSDGFFDHSEYRQNGGYAKFDYALGQTGRISLATFTDVGREAQLLPAYPDYWDDREQRRTYEKLSFEIAPTDATKLTTELWHHSYDTHIDDVYVDHRELYNDYTDESWGGSVRWQWDAAKSHAVIAGFDIDWGEYDWVFYEDTYDTRNWAVWANDTIALGSVHVNVGLRYDNNLNFGSELSPSLGAVYRFSRYDALIRAQVSRGFSAPPPALINDPTYGNPDLKAETAINYQIGGQIQPNRYVKAELNLFRADVDDLITWNYDTERHQNIDSVTRQGIEGGVSVFSDFGLTLYFGGTYVDVFNEKTDERIEDIPKLIYTARVQYAGQRFTNTLVGRMVDHCSSFPETRDKRFVWDYKASIRLPTLESHGRYHLFASIHNLTDSDYIVRPNWPKPGRWVEGGLQFAF
ncbi:putative Ligand-gated TonB-dependent outer membrane channel [Desulfosarcina cetonica]|uniref:TonB-dependent receptor family protein n=1 Tax=Desulfosarcina cetonica TaxID=90730 RepID=UPI0006D20149|nr:TonB-dependent receptor [Desulfosarcina cetonica]VTR68696.1 putative Ligand-gated TonB-dependent outer membrane channel [Desulfosarcina cetonica]